MTLFISPYNPESMRKVDYSFNYRLSTGRMSKEIFDMFLTDASERLSMTEKNPRVRMTRLDYGSSELS